MAPSPPTTPVAVVTGAGRGLGAAVALRLAQAGHAVALLGHEPQRLAEVAIACRAAGAPDARSWQVDVTDGEALRAVAAQVEQQLGPAGVLVVNAGVAVGGPLALVEPNAYDRVIEVNLLGSIRTARAFLAQLERSRGYLLQIASLAAIVPVPGGSAYCASKSGVEAYALSIRPELAHRGIKVGIAYLTWVDTDMVRGTDESPTLAAQRKSLPAPLNRTFPLDFAATRLVEGILKRKTYVYVPGWLPVLRFLRPYLPALASGRYGAMRAKQVEASLLNETTGPITRFAGAGGAADARETGIR